MKMMKVLDRCEINGRPGTLFPIDKLPIEAEVGMFVNDGRRRYRIRGFERFCMPRRDGEPAGLLLDAEPSDVPPGTVLVLEA